MILTSGCNVLPVVSAVISSGGSYYSYKAANAEKVEVTTISKECHLYHYVSVPCERRAELKQSKEGTNLLRSIADNNKLIVENCPNIDKPEPLQCN